MSSEQKILKVRKNNKKTEEFDKQKIITAVKSAADEVKQEIPESTLSRIANDIYNSFYEQKDINIVKVDDISKLVEDKLMASNYKDTARSYIKYHYDKEKERLANSEIIKQFKKKLDGVNIENQNANVDENTFSGRMQEAADIFLKDDALNNRMSKMARENHINNEIYIHDLSSFSSGMHNCLSVPFDEILEYGFITRQTDIRSPRSVGSALQLVAVIFQLQSLQQFGGVSATHLDHTLVPYFRYSFAKHYKDGLKYLKNVEWKKPKDEIIKNTSIEDKNLYSDNKAYQYALELTTRETKQGCESLYHNLNSLQSRSGAQLPFTSINYGTCILKEGQIIIDSFLEASLAGTGPLHKTSIFPCGIWQYKKGINDKPGTPNYELFKKALKSTSLRIYPNYCNVDWSVDLNGVKIDREVKQKVLDKLSDEQIQKIKGWIKSNKDKATLLGFDTNSKDVKLTYEPNYLEYNSTMGCRTYSAWDINFDEDYYRTNIIDFILKDKEFRRGTLFSAAQKDGRGNICPVSIILPTLAMRANKDVEKFMSLLDKKIDEAKDMLIERFEYIASQTPLAAPFMYGNATMFGYIPEEGIRSALKHGSLAIGQLGIAETLELLVGCNQTKTLGFELAERIEQLYKEKCYKFKREYKLNFGVYATPAENLCFTAMKKFKAEFGEIKNVSDHDYFTNSLHVPVWENITPFEKIDIESKLLQYTSAGIITYVEVESSVSKNINALEKLVNYAMEKDVPYFAINLPINTCMKCGFQGDIENSCPACGSKDIQRLGRITGYLSTDISNFNIGKQQEFKNRVKHIGKIDC